MVTGWAGFHLLRAFSATFTGPRVAEVLALVDLAARPPNSTAIAGAIGAIGAIGWGCDNFHYGFKVAAYGRDGCGAMRPKWGKSRRDASKSGGQQ
jgi:hypothetical protein